MYIDNVIERREAELREHVVPLGADPNAAVDTYQHALAGYMRPGSKTPTVAQANRAFKETVEYFNRIFQN